jgi:hypothetical protein
MKRFVLVSIVAFMVVLVATPLVRAQEDSGFALQVTPSPLIATIEPGKKSTLELRINNTGSTKESFSMDLRSFTVDKQSGKVDLLNEKPKEISSFVSFSEPTFTLEPAQWVTQRVIVDTPKDAGFSYSFAIMVVRDEKTAPQNSGAAIQGSVAVFTLLNVSRPDANRELRVIEFSSAKKVYEYLPSNLSLKIENTGNTIVAPSGNIFISRNTSDKDSLRVLQINESGGYILPDSTRILDVAWDDGFPVHKTVDGVQKTVWDFSKLSQLRIGRYTAKAIVIYDDGERDIPIEAVVSFWVIPWKLIIGFMVILGLILVGVLTTLKKSKSLFKFKRKPKQDEEKIS